MQRDEAVSEVERLSTQLQLQQLEQKQELLIQQTQFEEKHASRDRSNGASHEETGRLRMQRDEAVSEVERLSAQMQLQQLEHTEHLSAQEQEQLEQTHHLQQQLEGALRQRDDSIEEVRS